VKTADPVTIQSSSGNQATLVNHADQFNIGDIVVLTKDQTSERATITWKDGLTLSFKEALANQYGNGTVRIADLEPGQRTFRLNDVSNIEPGTYLQISQEGASEVVVVEKIDRINQVVTLDVPGLHGGYGRAETTVPTVSSKEFQLVVTPPPGGGDPETFEACSLDQRHNKYVLKIKSKYVSITFTDPRPQTVPPNNLPAPLTATALTGGRMITSGTLQAPTTRPRSMN
jgi:hypothetical protein